MESGVVNSWANSNCCIVEDFFTQNFPQFHIKSKYAYSPYWNIILEFDYVKIKIDGDIGFSIDIFIDDDTYQLWQYDRSIIDKMKTTDDNILYQLNVLKRFLNEVGF